MECKKKLDVLQRKMIRFILDLDFRAHVDCTHLKCLGWLNVSDRAKYFRLLHVFRINSNQSPEYLMENFTRVNAIHGHSTRGSAANFFVPKISSTEILKGAFFSVVLTTGTHFLLLLNLYVVKSLSNLV